MDRHTPECRSWESGLGGCGLHVVRSHALSQVGHGAFQDRVAGSTCWFKKSRSCQESFFKLHMSRQVWWLCACSRLTAQVGSWLVLSLWHIPCGVSVAYTLRLPHHSLCCLCEVSLCHIHCRTLVGLVSVAYSLCPTALSFLSFLVGCHKGATGSGVSNKCNKRRCLEDETHALGTCQD